MYAPFDLDLYDLVTLKQACTKFDDNRLKTSGQSYIQGEHFTDKGYVLNYNNIVIKRRGCKISLAQRCPAILDFPARLVKLSQNFFIEILPYLCGNKSMPGNYNHCNRECMCCKPLGLLHDKHDMGLVIIIFPLVKKKVGILHSREVPNMKSSYI